MNVYYPNTDGYNPNKNEKTLMVSDNMITNIFSNKNT